MNPNRSVIQSAPLFKLKDSQEENMWDDFEFGFDHSKYFEYYNDFFNYTAGDWTITSTGSGSRALADENGGTVLLTTGGTDNDSEELQLGAECILPASGKFVWFEARFNISHASDLDWWIGISDTDTEIIDGVSEGIFFSGTDATAAIDFSSVNASVTSSESGLKVTVADTYYKVGFKLSSTNQVEYWVDDVKQGTITTNIPATEMRIGMAVQAGSGNARALEVDYIRMVSTRV